MTTATAEPEQTKTETPFDLGMKRATKLVELGTGFIVLLWYFDTLDRGATRSALIWHAREMRRRALYQRRLRASELWAVVQAEQVIEAEA